MDFVTECFIKGYQLKFQHENSCFFNKLVCFQQMVDKKYKQDKLISKIEVTS